MENLVKKLLAGTGALLVASMAFLPIASYAASSSATTTVSLTVNPVLSIDAASGGSSVALAYNAVRTGTITTNITSNTKYYVQLSATNPNLVNTTNSSYSIPASSSVAAGTNAWGVRKNGETNYTALTTSAVTFYDGTKSANPSFTFGISLGDTMAAGTYSTAVKVSAVRHS